MIPKIATLSKLEKLKLAGLCVKSATAVGGGSLILVEGHPYLTIFILAMGGVANEVISFVREKENQVQKENLIQENPAQ